MSVALIGPLAVSSSDRTILMTFLRGLCAVLGAGLWTRLWTRVCTAPAGGVYGSPKMRRDKKLIRDTPDGFQRLGDLRHGIAAHEAIAVFVGFDQGQGAESVFQCLPLRLDQVVVHWASPMGAKAECRFGQTFFEEGLDF